MKFDVLPLPNSLKGQRRNLFGNIEAIYEIHESEIFPSLQSCRLDPQKVAEVFLHFIDNNRFDTYITYGLNRKKASELCIENAYFFKQMQTDQLGINSFLLEPVQRLPRYRMLLERIVQDLAQDLVNNKTAISVCCVAEKRIQKLLQMVDNYCARD